MATVETISAWENVSWLFGQVFHWLVAFSGTLSDLGNLLLGIAGVIGVCQFRIWRKQTLSRRAHDLALDAVEELRNYANLLNAARMRRIDTPEYRAEHFEEARGFLTRAMQSRAEIVRLCSLIEDLGFGDVAKDAAQDLIVSERRVKRPLESAHHAFERGEEENMWKHLSDFFWSPGAETELDQELKMKQDALRKILLERVRLSS